MIQIYGIKNCDTVKKALKWLEQNSLDYQFHDFKKEIPSQPQIIHWLSQVPAETLINRRGTTWRKLSDEEKAITDPDALAQLIIDNTSLIKRPLVEAGASVSVGFKAEDWQQRLLGQTAQ